jgi:hypothetical protein
MWNPEIKLEALQTRGEMHGWHDAHYTADKVQTSAAA